MERGTRAESEAWVPPSGRAPWIAALGHSDHGEEVFFGILARAGVATLVDVRSHPVSHVAHFNKDPLAAACRARGVAYHHLPGLGGLRRVAYAEHMQTPDWQRAYARLKEIAFGAMHAGHTAAFLCVERDPADCHRRFIARALEADGWRVQHILPDEGQTRLF